MLDNDYEWTKSQRNQLHHIVIVFTTYVKVWAKEENLAKGGPLATVGPTSEHSENYFRNDGESACGWLY